MATKRKVSAMGAAVDDEPVDPSDELAFYCLGGGNEVGRSCHILEYKGKTVMVGGLRGLQKHTRHILTFGCSLTQVCTRRRKASLHYPSLMSSI
jgi:predicted metal-dependent RNase